MFRPGAPGSKDPGAPDVPPSASIRPTWEALQASRPMKMRFRLLPSVHTLPPAAAAAALRRRRREGTGPVGTEGVDARIELTAAFELQLPDSGQGDEDHASSVPSSSSSPLTFSSSSTLRILRLLSPTLTRDVLSSSTGSQPLINLDALLLALGISPLHGLLRLGLSRFKGDFELDLPRSGAASGAGEEWKRGIWVSLRTARRAVKELYGAGNAGNKGGEEGLRFFGAFLAWGSREAWSLDEGEEEGRMSHNWIPSPTPLQPSSSLSTSSLLTASISSLTLLPRSNPTVATFLSQSQRQELLQEHDERDRSREGQVERARTRLRRWTVELLEAIEVRREDWPEEDREESSRHEQKKTTAIAKTNTSRRLLGAVTSEANDWREASLSQLLPILSNLEEEVGGNYSGGSVSSTAAPQESVVPSHLQLFLPSNLPEELKVQLQLVEHLWTVSERLHSYSASHPDHTPPTQLNQSVSSEVEAKHVSTTSAGLRPASPTSSSTAVSPAFDQSPASADKTQLQTRPRTSLSLDGNHSVVTGGPVTRPTDHQAVSSGVPQATRDGSLMAVKIGLLGNWIRFTFTIGPDPEKRDKDSSVKAGGTAGAQGRKRETTKRTPRYHGRGAEWSSNSALSWALGACLVAVIAVVVGLITPAMGSSAKSRPIVA